MAPPINYDYLTHRHPKLIGSIRRFGTGSTLLLEPLWRLVVDVAVRRSKRRTRS